MAEGQKAAAKPARPMGMIIFFAVTALNFVAGGAGLFLTYKATLGHVYPSTTEEDAQRELANEPHNAEADQPVLYTLEPFVVNLGGTPQQVIRLQLSLEMLDQDGFEEIMGLGGRSRDEIMRVLNSKNFSEIESLQGKLFLKDQIALALNKALNHGVVKDVYFTDFVVQ
jgi:flagellar FliL protein